jgi:hypothetical protein
VLADPAVLTVLNDPQSEWIIEEILSPEKYEGYFLRHKGEFGRLIKSSLLDSVYAVKDYALNNIMLIVAADGGSKLPQEA